jgi:hypothetical protein
LFGAVVGTEDDGLACLERERLGADVERQQAGAGRDVQNFGQRRRDD